jgi:hypothetical protein
MGWSFAKYPDLSLRENVEAIKLEFVLGFSIEMPFLGAKYSLAGLQEDFSSCYI